MSSGAFAFRTALYPLCDSLPYVTTPALSDSQPYVTTPALWVFLPCVTLMRRFIVILRDPTERLRSWFQHRGYMLSPEPLG
jgi:hypothetical protein